MKVKFDIEQLGKDLIKERKNLNISHRRISKEMKVPHATLHRLEKGKQKDIRVETLVKICYWLNTSPASYFKSVRK